jgi:hypothetical protein
MSRHRRASPAAAAFLGCIGPFHPWVLDMARSAATPPPGAGMADREPELQQDIRLI